MSLPIRISCWFFVGYLFDLTVKILDWRHSVGASLSRDLLILGFARRGKAGVYASGISESTVALAARRAWHSRKA